MKALTEEQLWFIRDAVSAGWGISIGESYGDDPFVEALGLIDDALEIPKGERCKANSYKRCRCPRCKNE